MTDYAQQAREMTQIDTNLAADHFAFYLNQGVSLEQVDAENEISILERRIAGTKKAIQKMTNAMNYQQARFGSIEPKLAYDYDNAVDRLVEFEEKLAATITKCDNLASGDENFVVMDHNEFEDENTSIGKEIVEFLFLYADRLSSSELCDIYHATCHMHEDKEISWYHYLVIGIATTKRLARMTKKDAGWWEECDRLIKNKAKYQPRCEVPTGDDSFHGQMNFDMEAAIDMMRIIRPVAARNGVTCEEAAELLDY